MIKLTTPFILIIAFIISTPVHAQGGHGPVFTLATPTLGQGELSFDAMAMSTKHDKQAWMLRQNWHYGVTEDIQLNLSIPTSLRKIAAPPHGRLGTMMGSYGDLELSALFRFFKTYPGVGKRFESTVLLGGSIPTDTKRGGIKVGPSVNAALVTGYASRSFYFWLGGGYQYYDKRGSDQLGDIKYITGVIGYRPPTFQHDYPKPDWRVFLESVTEWVGSSQLNGNSLSGSDGMKTLIGPSVLGLFGKWGVSTGIMFPLYNDFNNGANREDYRLSVVVSYWF
ncbi:hypothetical protein [Gracilimonas sediminicola]|uniref:MetA-pathway of phenol degradation n=1 Tax=Gracilimonas sediminicola TaxID=2952158 RepID=A0A9X2L1H5_9BACT|nr:hypothetical protein [Gracilimonas sediminicola]MCP9290552.1 hypothetical protein [Gracilimonas sediminicola]